MKKKIIIASAVIFITAALVTALKLTGVLSKGNMPKYSVRSTAEAADSSLKGKKIIFLGSSVTYGYAAQGTSFVEYLEKRDGVIALKEAVSGTTLADLKKSSYVSRLKTIDTSFEADAFICQLSTNDATKNIPLGEVSDSFNENDFDTKTVSGAIEFVISYVQRTWNCPVIFYTGTQYESEAYEAMISRLHELEKKWDIYVIDLWNNGINDIPENAYSLYMADPIHPTKAGYRDWWLPEFEESLKRIFS